MDVKFFMIVKAKTLKVWTWDLLKLYIRQSEITLNYIVVIIFWHSFSWEKKKKRGRGGANPWKQEKQSFSYKCIIAHVAMFLKMSGIQIKANEQYIFENLK